jgi:hypothetical protein
MRRFLLIFSSSVVAILGSAGACAAAPSYEPSTHPTVEIRTTEATVGRHLWLRLSVYCAGPAGSICSGYANLVHPSYCCPIRDHPPLAHARRYNLLAGAERPIALQLRSKIKRPMNVHAVFGVSHETVSQLVVLRPRPRRS